MEAYLQIFHYFVLKIKRDCSMLYSVNVTVRSTMAKGLVREGMYSIRHPTSCKANQQSICIKMTG